MKLLLDTCTFLWIAQNPERVSKVATAAYMNPDNERYLSSASVWEIAIKHRAGRLPLPKPLFQSIAEFRLRSASDTLPIDEECALHLSRLPMIHGDPFDRMLVAQALVHSMTILTPDAKIASYPARVLW